MTISNLFYQHIFYFAVHSTAYKQYFEVYDNAHVLVMSTVNPDRLKPNQNIGKRGF